MPPQPPLSSASALLAAVAAAFLSVTVAASTLAAGWVPGGGLLPLVALVACLLGLLVGAAGLVGEPPWLVALALETGVAAAVAATAFDVHALPFGLGPAAVSSGDQLGLALLYGLTWVGPAILGWTLASGRATVLAALATPVALLAVNVLNHPDDQQGYALVAVAVSLLLLMAANHTRLAGLARTDPAGPRLARRRFWGAGAATAAVVLAAAALLPPLSSVDQTTGGPWLLWSDLVHSATTGAATGAAAGSGVIGLSTSAGLFGGITEGAEQVVFTYTPDPNAPGPYYFRAVDLAQAVNGEWLPPAASPALGLPAGRPLAYAETYAAEVTSKLTVDYVHPVVVPAGLLVYPGRLLASDRASYTREASSAGGSLLTLDSVQSRAVGGRVVEQVAFPAPAASRLRAAGTDYPAWVLPYAGALTSAGYRSPEVLGRVAALARQVTAGTGNPYDAAAAIESYLRDSFTYTLTPPGPPPGTDPLEYFLFTSKQGYCQYFAIAMGDMLRSLGIPARLVNGFGPGTQDPTTGAWSVRTSDAHTWVEAYFPAYGWIPFEPTADGTYFPITRAPEPDAGTAAAPDTAAAPAASGASGVPAVIGRGTGWIAARRADIPWALLLAALVVLAAMLAALSAARPRTAGAAWRRLRWVTRVAGVGQEPGETPLEFGARLGRWQPAVASEFRLIAERFTAAAYAPPARAPAHAAEVVQAWRSVRSALFRKAVRR